MYLKTIKYSESLDQPAAWIIDEFSLSRINLLVGKNATGKTRTINVINGLANLVCGLDKRKFSSGNFEATFLDGQKPIRYILDFKNSKITKELYTEDEKILMNRTIDGEGMIWADAENKDMKFHLKDTELACVSRADKFQHPFFIKLNQWGKLSLFYSFGTPLGKDAFFVFPREQNVKEEMLNLKAANNVVKIFDNGISKYKDTFKSKIIASMDAIGYSIDNIQTAEMPGLLLQSLNGIVSGKGIAVKEHDLKGLTYQISMSQGMFRCLSLLIQLHYSNLSSIPSLILIDDIGEGLDYQRAVALINQVIKIARESSFQLIMSTNDRFVMNEVPLEYWQVIQRNHNNCKIFNYENSKEIFDNFSFTGLSNFDFLSTDFLSAKDFGK